MFKIHRKIAVPESHDKVPAMQPVTLIKMRLRCMCFPVSFTNFND